MAEDSRRQPSESELWLDKILGTVGDPPNELFALVAVCPLRGTESHDGPTPGVTVLARRGLTDLQAGPLETSILGLSIDHQGSASFRGPNGVEIHRQSAAQLARVCCELGLRASWAEASVVASYRALAVVVVGGRNIDPPGDEKRVVLRNLAGNACTAILQLRGEVSEPPVPAEPAEEHAQLDLLSLRRLDETLAAVCEASCASLMADVTHVALVDSSGGRVTVLASCGARDIRWKGLSLALGEGFCGRSAQDRKVYSGLHDPELKDEPANVTSIAFEEGVRSSICVPLQANEQLLGVLWLCFRQTVQHPREELRRIRRFAAGAATAIANAKLFERASWEADAGQRLIALLRSASDPASLARLVSELADNPVAFYDRQQVFLACHPPNLSALVKSEAVEFKHEIERGARPEWANLQSTLEEQKRGVLIPENKGWEWPFDRAQAPAIIGDDLFGFVEIIGMHHSLAEADVRLAESAGTALALQLFLERAASESEHRLRGEMLDDLLSGSREAVEGAVRRSAHLGHHLSGPHVVMVCEVPDFASLATSRGWNARQSVRSSEALRENVIRVCANLRVEGLVAQREGRVVVVLPTPADGAVVATRDIGAAVMSRLRGLMPALPMRVSIGGQVDAVRHIRKSYDDAILALRISKSCGIDRDVLYSDDLGILSLLSDGTDPAKLARFIERRVGGLIDYDRDNTTDLVKTLSAYLDHYCSKSATARSLNIHINTLKYRLKKITDVCGLDCDDVTNLFPVHLALHMKKTIDMLYFEETLIENI